MVPKSERFEMRLDEKVLQEVDQWRRDQPDLPSRSEAVRRLVAAGLEARGTESDTPVRFTDGEKLLLIMMRDLFKRLNIEDPEVDPEFIAQVIWGGHYWAAEWDLPGVFHRDSDDRRDLNYVQDVLDMWDRLERGFDRLQKSDKERVAQEAAPLGKKVRFPGFDGNNEGRFLGIARFLTNQMERWTRFAGRDLNSHMPTTAMYKRMLEAFEPMKKSFEDDLNLSQVVKLLTSMRHPES